MKKATSKKTNNSTQKKTPPKPRTSTKKTTRYHALKTLMGWINYDPGEKWIERIADELIEFAADADNHSFTQFYAWYGIPRQSYYEYLEKYTTLRVAHEKARDLFGANRERKMYAHNPTAMAMTQYEYHEDFKKIQDHREAHQKALRNAEANEKPTHITVVREDYGSSNDDK